MAHYVKLFESIIHSTLWSNEPPATRVVWVTMLAMADSNGEVQASIPGLAKAAGVSLEECETALQCFLSPDPYSRSKEEEGRRIQEIRGGWELINYRYYRQLKSVEQEKENAAERQQRARERKKAVTVVTESHRESRHIEEEEDVEEGKNKNSAAPSAPLLPKPKRRNLASLDIIKKDSDRQAFQSLWEDWPKRSDGKPSRGSRPKAELCFQKILEAGEVKAFELLEASAVYREEWSQVKEGWIQNVSTFLALEAGLWKQCVKVIRARSMEAM